MSHGSKTMTPKQNPSLLNGSCLDHHIERRHGKVGENQSDVDGIS